MKIGQISFLQMTTAGRASLRQRRGGLEVPGPARADAEPLLPELPGPLKARRSAPFERHCPHGPRRTRRRVTRPRCSAAVASRSRSTSSCWRRAVGPHGDVTHTTTSDAPSVPAHRRPRAASSASRSAATSTCGTGRSVRVRGDHASLVAFLDLVVLQALHRRELGKLCVGLRVVDEQGRRPASCACSGAGCCCSSTSGCLLVGLITTLATHPHRRVGDLVCGTYVVVEASVGQPIGAFRYSPPATSRPADGPVAPVPAPPAAAPSPPISVRRRVHPGAAGRAPTDFDAHHRCGFALGEAAVPKPKKAPAEQATAKPRLRPAAKPDGLRRSRSCRRSRRAAEAAEAAGPEGHVPGVRLQQLPIGGGPARRSSSVRFGAAASTLICTWSGARPRRRSGRRSRARPPAGR